MKYDGALVVSQLFEQRPHTPASAAPGRGEEHTSVQLGT
jgi:hypothetical protein